MAGADALLAVGGAQAIAALAYGVGQVPACDVIVGPGSPPLFHSLSLLRVSLPISLSLCPSLSFSARSLVAVCC